MRVEGADFSFSDGAITFFAHAVPVFGAAVRAGYRFDVPVRFDADRLEVNHSRFIAGEILSIPMVEIVP